MRILVLDGPNLNQLGTRQPEIYGTTTRAAIAARMRAEAAPRGVLLEFFQSNSEGAMVDWLQERAPGAGALIVNPGGLAHSSVVLRDAIAACGLATIEVHLTNIHAREPFRRRSLVAGVVRGTIAGLGPEGYVAALRALCPAGEEHRAGG